MPGLVETSTNLASVKFEGDDRIVVTTSQRSSVESAKVYASQMIESVFALAGAEVSQFGGVSRLGAQSPVQTVGNHGCQL